MKIFYDWSLTQETNKHSIINDSTMIYDLILQISMSFAEVP
jgi:hypothetical protein